MNLPWSKRELRESVVLFVAGVVVCLVTLLLARDANLGAALGLSFFLATLVTGIWLATVRFRRPYYQADETAPVTFMGPPSLRSIRVLMALTATSTSVMIAIAALATPDRRMEVLLIGLALVIIDELLLLAWWKLARKRLEASGMRW